MEIDIADMGSPHAIDMEVLGPGTKTPPVAERVSSRAALLKEAFDKVLEYGLKDPSREDFGVYFPSMDTALVDALYDAYKQAAALVRFHCQEEYQVICAEHHLLGRLQSLDKLADEAKAVEVATATPRTGATAATPGRKTSSAGLAGHEVSEAVVHNAERIARRYALWQEAQHLQDMLEKARRTESRLSTTLALRKEAVDKLVATYQRVVTDVKQVYDITRVWPTSASPSETFD